MNRPLFAVMYTFALNDKFAGVKEFGAFSRSRSPRTRWPFPFNIFSVISLSYYVPPQRKPCDTSDSNVKDVSGVAMSSGTKVVAEALRDKGRWRPCSVCQLDCQWGHILKSDAYRANITHHCRCCVLVNGHADTSLPQNVLNFHHLIDWPIVCLCDFPVSDRLCSILHRACGRVVCSVCAPAGDKIHGDGKDSVEHIRNHQHSVTNTSPYGMKCSMGAQAIPHTTCIVFRRNQCGHQDIGLQNIASAFG